MSRTAGERWDCDGCGKKLIGALTKNGSVAPIELEPDERGNVILQTNTTDRQVHAITLGFDSAGKVAEAGAELRLNHFSTCPERTRFMRRPPSEDAT
jgi:copper chaperone CopZ